MIFDFCLLRRTDIRKRRFFPSRFVLLIVSRKTLCLSLEEKPWGLVPTRRAETSAEKRRGRTKDKKERKGKNREKDRKKKVPLIMDNTFNPTYEVLPF